MNNFNLEEVEYLYQEALEAVKNCNQCSPSFFQRKLQVGYAKASKIVDLLEERGIIGKFNGSKPREILLSNK